MSAPAPSNRLSFPEQQLHLRFINATNEVAQHPSVGVAMVGATAMRYIQNGRLTPEQVFAFAGPNSAPEPVVSVTSATHALVGAYGIPRDRLRGSVGFAYGLVGHGLVTTAVEMDKRHEGIVLPKLEVATPEQQAHFSEIAADPARAARVREVFGDVALALQDINDEATQQRIDEYHETILGVSETYAKDHNNGARMAELGMARDELAGALTDTVVSALVPHMNQSEAGVTAQNILRHDPGPQLLNQYLGVPLPS